MANGSEVSEKNNKMSDIGKNIDYLRETCKSNLCLSSEIRAKLLCSEAEKTAGEEKVPRGPGQLNNIIDSLQELLNVVNATHVHLMAVNKEV